MLRFLLASIFLISPVTGIFYFPCSDNGMNSAVGTFPSNFMWGVGSSAYQTEGGWNADGKGPSIWDTFTHRKPGIANNANGDVACDSYHKWQEDVDLVKALKVGYYRFSLSWSRILPTGQPNNVNQAGVQFYTNLINKLNASGIQPVVTLYHFDLPQALQNQGGWANSSSPNWFRDYARFCFLTFGKRVNYWVTIQEPHDISVFGYTPGEIFAPEDDGHPATRPYTVGHNLIKAHAMAYRLYHGDSKYGSGKVGIALNLDYNIPATMKEEDSLATIRANDFWMGWFAHPIFVNGDYPPLMKQVVGYRSNAAGLPTSRLPDFSAADRALINGSADFFGLSQYTSNLIADKPVNPAHTKDFYDDLQVEMSKCSQWEGGSFWDKMTPWSIRRVLLYIKAEYGNPPVFILGNGFLDRNGSISDSWRSEYFRRSISNVLYATTKENCNVIGYIAYALMDSFEWVDGYTDKFGLHYVNFSDPARPRKAKQSAQTYASIVEANGFPASITTTTPKGSSPLQTSGMLLPIVLLVVTLVGRLYS